MTRDRRHDGERPATYEERLARGDYDDGDGTAAGVVGERATTHDENTDGNDGTSAALTGATVTPINAAKERVDDQPAPAPVVDVVEVVEDDDELTETPITSASIPEWFWEPRALRCIRDCALARYVTPEALLGAVLVETLSRVEPSVMLPPIVGTAVSLNLYVNLIARSGLGKSSSVGTARDVLAVTATDHNPKRAQLGSGQGLVEAYLAMTGKTKYQAETSVVFTVDEGAALYALAAQRESTLLSTLRTAWMGQDLGNANAAQDTRRHLDAHAYRLGLVVNFTPAAAAELLRGVEYGTPQRFLWMNAEPRGLVVSTETTWEPLRWKPPPAMSDPYPIRLPDSVVEAIVLEHVERANGKSFDPYDSHSNLLCLKVAVALALLDDTREFERYVVRAEDWERALIVLAHSNATRAALLHLLADKRRRAERSRRRSLGDDRVAETAAVDRYAAAACAQRVAAIIWGSAGEWTTTAIRRRLSPRQRDAFEDALDEAKRNGWVVERAARGQGEPKRVIERGTVQP